MRSTFCSSVGSSDFICIPKVCFIHFRVNISTCHRQWNSFLPYLSAGLALIIILFSSESDYSSRFHQKKFISIFILLKKSILQLLTKFLPLFISEEKNFGVITIYESWLMSSVYQENLKMFSLCHKSLSLKGWKLDVHCFTHSLFSCNPETIMKTLNEFFIFY